MHRTHPVGIDLGTTYSCISYLNEHGEPKTLVNSAGELSTPSVVLFDDDRPVVGTEALRHAIMWPDRVVLHAKRYLGDPNKRWNIGGRPITPTDATMLILKELLAGARAEIGEVNQAVITVPAQFSEAQRLATIEAGHRAGLERVDLINEPVAAALCHVIGTEGLWFTELAADQRILVFDLGGGTLDLALVQYSPNSVSVIASDGDLQLGGLDWNQCLLDALAQQFIKEFRLDPRQDPESLQFLANEVEQAKRGLSIRSRVPLTCQHAGHRKSYQIEQSQFQRLTSHLVDRAEEVTKRLLRDRKMGWAHVDVVLTTGGASRMPMIRERLKTLSGRTLNTSLSPDLSIAHGATYYAGMLASNNKFAKSILNEAATSRLSRIKQQSVNARGLGVIIRDEKTKAKIPHFLIPSNTPLPARAMQKFGTVIPDQKRVRLVIVESGTDPKEPAVKLGDCTIEQLPPGLPAGSEIAVTIQYDEQAKVHVAANMVATGQRAEAEIFRAENVMPQLASDQRHGHEQKQETEAMLVPRQTTQSRSETSPPRQSAPHPHPQDSAIHRKKTASAQDSRDPGEEEFWKT